jgi:ElaB/YqjD/DUF883 family membrane-anchored ribosome-binding protein
VSPFRILLAVSCLTLLGCSESPESSIDSIADKSKELVSEARELAEDASERVSDELEEARETASEKTSEAVRKLQDK